jgi:hypothetical protein
MRDELKWCRMSTRCELVKLMLDVSDMINAAGLALWEDLVEMYRALIGLTDSRWSSK